jgi:hypothetical protein
MNVIATLIFSHPSLGYNKADIKFPIDVNIKYPMNGSGLCNQLFRFINVISLMRNETVYFDLFAKDIYTGEMIELSSIIDLDAMRSKYGYSIYDITQFNKQDDFQVYDNHYVFMLYDRDKIKFKDIVENIIWGEKYEELSKKIILDKNLDNKLINLVHLRIDEDYKTHVMGNRSNVDEDYTTPYWKNREKAYYELIDRYRKEIYVNCDRTIPLILLMEDINHEFVQELKKDYDIIFFEKETVLKYQSDINGRELFALVDLLIGKNLNVNNFIGLENNEPLIDGNKHVSSFSVLLKFLTSAKKITMI